MKPNKLATIELQIVGMHCSSCAINIDFEVEDLDGVKKVETNYVRARSVVVYDPSRIVPEKILDVVSKLGYTAQVFEVKKERE